MRAACLRRSLALEPSSASYFPRARRTGARYLRTSASQQRGTNHVVTHRQEHGINSTASSENESLQRPPLPSFPLAVKDNIATLGFPTQCASRILFQHASPFEATIVKQLRSLGAEVVGKTNMDEFGMGSHSVHSAHGPVVNGFPASSSDDALSAGGSSGGSAVAIQLGDALVALGTDTGGSVRLPAAYTGIVGFKPSYGMLSRHGVVPYANSLDTVGIMARDVDVICKLLFDSGLYMEHDPRDPTSLSSETRRSCDRPISNEKSSNGDVAGLTIGIPVEYNIAELDPALRQTWMAAAASLQERGASVVPVSLPSTKEALCAYYVLAPAEASSNLAKYDGVRFGVRVTGSSDAAGHTLYSATRGEGFGDEVKRRILLGTYTLSSEAIDNYFIQAQKVRRLVQHDFDRVFRQPNPLQEPRQFDLSDMPDTLRLRDKQGPEQVDFLLCPTAPTFPPTLREVAGQDSVDSYMNDVFTVPASLAGLPAVSVPASVEGNALPAGLQLIGQFWDDRRLLTVASLLMQMIRDP